MTTQERTHFWQKQITAWQASGLSGPAFCKQHDLAYHQFVYWRQKQGPQCVGQTVAAGFARVTTPVAEVRDELTLSLPNGVSITGLHSGNVELLGAILRQL
jgi:hypothetical protein